ncbi:AI-2E family transporter [Sphingomicrobium nitratireducens]|uniref:AI-2E family transporter n=1 Tax=Sphingomicrobium nitratireducens TaxID=2964666 RepID=UPI00223FC023|nr:AI-2E family transporter [Sphingomicrobium nitratireducens]
MTDESMTRGPTEIDDPRLRFEVRKAAIWIGMVLLAAGVVVLAGPLLLIVGGLVFAVLLDGGTRLLGRVLPIARGWRLAIIVLSFFAFLGWTFWYAGTALATQFTDLRDTVIEQVNRLLEWAAASGLVPEASFSNISGQLVGSLGKVTSLLGTAVGAFASGLMILVIGIFIAAEPRLYDRGVAWMLPRSSRQSFFEISDRVGYSLRRLLAGRLVGMVFEGVFTYIMLLLGGVPLAALLGLLTGLLAFIPNIGAIISGILMVAVGFSAGTGEGLWAIFVYFFVQNVDGYLVIPMIAKKTVDLAPALVLAMQLIMGALFGFLGLLLADPIVASIKAALEEYAKEKREAEEGETAPQGGSG